jgi:hypothetical protein
MIIYGTMHLKRNAPCYCSELIDVAINKVPFGRDETFFECDVIYGFTKLRHIMSEMFIWKRPKKVWRLH